ncbi:TetR family transcriptional regulator [Murinocardiopsis flavida]|uniref:TetR family transcriptional regulator n=1 Tax=Murinocardiopsis flavida TaxID=645275 RepID=A0A2P8DUU8_9ACTN|nr:TetR/AcrR family transcriptional regulator [Murinocardiopsis flavida]PSL00980.1 TetR family transcriptional regulator [Murinocardiopsis flavida]
MTLPTTTPEETADTERAERARRILDAAAELLVAWGYRRVTIDEVARRAGVGKGTVYLHWKTKEALFLVVLLRAKSSSFATYVRRMRADPREVLPSRMLRSMYLELGADPVARAMYLGDSETLGRLGEVSARELRSFSEEGARGLEEHFRLLRDAGALRTDLPLRTQTYSYLATALGFVTMHTLDTPLAPEPGAGDPSPLDPPAAPGVLAGADALAHTVRAALETGSGAESTAPAVIAVYERLEALCQEEITRQLRR